MWLQRFNETCYSSLRDPQRLWGAACLGCFVLGRVCSGPQFGTGMCRQPRREEVRQAAQRLSRPCCSSLRSPQCSQVAAPTECPVPGRALSGPLCGALGLNSAPACAVNQGERRQGKPRSASAGHAAHRCAVRSVPKSQPHLGAPYRAGYSVGLYSAQVCAVGEGGLLLEKVMWGGLVGRMPPSSQTLCTHRIGLGLKSVVFLLDGGTMPLETSVCRRDSKSRTRRCVSQGLTLFNFDRLGAEPPVEIRP
ncbi:hypothetical protein NDU88_007336 [Pleurodeles waltl]|uniref:Uncharacterized protein n=1 Tax=Pleurodeles waltl TaxID=8319 RepID=A0AAV7PPL3_PLEWA|nr:hypothetical protein NDU88_007336 [Pleurodeles waltl]